MSSTFDCTVAGLDCRVEYNDPRIPVRCRDYDVRGVAPVSSAIGPSPSAPLIRARYDAQRVTDMIRRCPGTVPFIAEWDCVYDQISRQMLRFNRLTFHGACIAFDGRAYIFTAYHGTGKSTHIGLWRRYLGPAVRFVNGDKPIIVVDPVDNAGGNQSGDSGGPGDHDIRVCGTPWCGKELWQTNIEVPLAAICIIRRGTDNVIRRATAEESLDELVNRIYLTDDPVEATEAMSLLGTILEHIPVYVLSCDMSEDAVKTSFEGLTGERYESWK